VLPAWLECSVHNLGIEVDDALNIADQVELWSIRNVACLPEL